MIPSFVKTLSAAIALFAAVVPVFAQTNAVRHEEIQVKAPFTMPVIKVPVFPKKDFNVTHFNEGKTVEISEAIRKAIAACHEAGGGRVVVPKGEGVPRRLISGGLSWFFEFPKGFSRRFAGGQPRETSSDINP